jgi:hypothetical protein
MHRYNPYAKTTRHAFFEAMQGIDAELNEQQK